MRSIGQDEIWQAVKGSRGKFLVGQAVKVSSGTMWNLRIICALCACCTLLLSALLYILTIFVIFMLYFTIDIRDYVVSNIYDFTLMYNNNLSQLHRNHAYLFLIISLHLCGEHARVRLCCRDYDNYLLLIIKTAVLKLTPTFSIREKSKCYDYFHTFKQKGCD